MYADGLLAVISILVVPYLIRRLGTEPYGILGIVSVLAGQLGVLHFGVGTAATRLIADSLGRGGEGLLARLTGVAVVGAAASLLVGTVFLLVAPAAWQGGFNVSAATLPLALASAPAAAAVDGRRERPRESGRAQDHDGGGAHRAGRRRGHRANWKGDGADPRGQRRRALRLARPRHARVG